MEPAVGDGGSFENDSPTLLALLREAAAFSDVLPTEQQPALARGDELGNGRFVIESMVGRGGMGCVYSALDRTLETRVAIKTLRKLAPTRLALFKREFRALADTRHDGLVRPGELVEDGHHLFFTMELVEGVGLREYLERHPEQAEAVFLQLTDVLSWMHDHGLVHCDVKPANIIVTIAGRVVLLDFGIAQRLRGLETTINEGFGTPAYMAPEQFEDVHLSGACDLYALGVMLFDHFTGQLPFRGTREELVRQKEQPHRPRTLAPHVPTAMDELIYRLLSPNPHQRPSAHELRRRLGGTTLQAPVNTELPANTEPFVGRERELSLLARSLGSVEAGETVAVHVHGPSGIGKSALVRHFLRQLAEGSAVVLAGRCYERESLAFKGIESVMDAVAKALLSLPQTTQQMLESDLRVVLRTFPSMAGALKVAPGRRPSDRAELMTAIQRVFRALTEHAPVVLFVDDVHWADADGLAVLSTLFDEQRGRRLLVTTSRSPDWGLPAVPVRSLEVRPMTPADVRELVADLGYDKAGHSRGLESLVEQAQGHPMLVTELVRAQGRSGYVSVELLLRQRFDQLSKAARELLEILVIVGTPLERAVLRDAAGLAPAEFDRRLEELRMHALVFSEGLHGNHKVETFHDRVRETLHQRVSAARERQVHEEVLSTLRARGVGDSERLALHYRGLGVRERGYAHTVLAAEGAVEAGAFGHAADLYSIAMQLAPSEQVTRLRVSRANALRRAWRSIEAAEELLRAAAGSAPGQAESYRRQAGELLLIGGELERGLQTVEPDLRRLGALPPQRMSVAMATTPLVKLRYSMLERLPKRLARLRASATSEDVDFLWRVGSAFTTIDPVRSLHLQTAGRTQALLRGDRLLIARGSGLEACMQAGAGSPRKAEALVDDAHAVLADALEAGEDPERVERIRQMVAGGEMVLALHFGRWESGFVAARDGQSEGRAWRNNWQHALRGLYLLHYEFHLGHYLRFLERLEDDLGDARARNDVYLRLAMRVWPQPVAALISDRPQEAQRVANEAKETLLRERHGGYFDALRVVASMMTALYRGDPHSALSLLKGRDMAAKVLYRASHYGRVHLRFFEAMSRMPNRRRVLERLRIRATAERLERDCVPWARIYAAFLKAQLANGDVDRLQELERARQTCRRFEQGGFVRLLDLASASREQRACANRALQEQGVVSPARFARLFLGDLVHASRL